MKNINLGIRKVCCRKLLLYCTKSKPYLIRYGNEYGYNQFDTSYCKDEHKSDYEYGDTILNGKIVAECDFEVEELYCDSYRDERDGYVGYFHALPNDDFEKGEKELQKKSCLDELQINGYLKEHNGYATHIKNLHIFDNPRELDDYEYTTISNGMRLRAVLWQAPRNMQKIIANGTDAILIPVSSQEMCRIANEEQEVLIRRNVLKEVLNNG